MKVLSKSSIYGLRALLYIVSQKTWNEYVSIRELSEKLDISFHFLTKILQTLTQRNILESYRGPHGGITLKVPPDQIYLIDIVKILEGDDFFDKCLLGLPGCGEKAPCPMHEFWKEVKAKLRDEFETTTLADLGSNINHRSLRLVA